MYRMVKTGGPETRLTFSNIMIRKDNKNISENTIKDVNLRQKIYCSQNNIGSMDNSNIGQNVLGQRRLHMESLEQAFYLKTW